MIKLSTKARYATRFLLELALNNGQTSMLLKDIACKQGISAGYLEQIVPLLKKANLIVAARGSKGGYSLGRDASKITIKEIVEAVEGPIAIVECKNLKNFCDRSGTCAAEKLWDEINNEIKKTFEKRTLKQLSEKQKNIIGENVINFSI